jgi:hypothetical protein
MTSLLTRDIYYFGAIGDAGHYLWTEDFGHMRGFETMQQLPWGYRIYAELCPSGEQVEGVARIHHLAGWTALAFWDRSVDHRPGSNSVFIFRGELTFDDAVARAKEKFPDVWARFRFEVREAT